MASTNKDTKPEKNYTKEFNTLTNMLILSKQCSKFLDELQTSRLHILQNIKKNENNFFEKNQQIVSKLNSLYDPTIFKSKVLEFSEELEELIESYCCHEYIEDIIDTDYDKSKRIVYCRLCELTKKL
jgi:hypothetical protein